MLSYENLGVTYSKVLEAYKVLRIISQDANADFEYTSCNLFTVPDGELHLISGGLEFIVGRYENEDSAKEMLERVRQAYVRDVKVVYLGRKVV